MEVSVLGPLRVVLSGEDVTPTGGRQRRLLVALADAGPDGASADRIGEVVWDDHDRPTDVASHVRTAVNRLRRQLGTATGEHGPVVTRHGGYALADDTVDVDLWQFERRIVDAGAELDPVRRSQTLAEALDLWRGQVFDELAGLLPLLPSIARLEEVRLGAEEDLVEGWLDQGRPDQALARALSLVDEHPYRERLRRSQVLALYRLGRQTDALRVLRAHRARMGEELGLGPSPQLDELEQLVLQHDPTLSGPGGAGRSLRGYRLGEILGVGDDSVVYRALQPTLDRPVAVKVLRTRAVNDPAHIRRFEREATLVARLDHPFVVPLYDYWREPGRVCLVSRLLPRSLAAAIGEDGRWSPARVRVLVSQIGAALLAAHGAGIVHRDVKAANILLDDDDHALLADFGVGTGTDRRTAGGAPHEIETQGPRSSHPDVVGLATVALQALTGTLAPITDVASSLDHIDLSADAIEALTSALEDRPGSSEIDLAELVERFCTEEPATAATARPDHVSEAVTNVANPYRGLEPFEAADERFFAGRSGIVAEMAARWTVGDRLLVLTGASGVGKSSIVRAGFLPALDRGDIDGSDRWFVTTMTPGPDPFRALADALAAVASQAPVDLYRALRRPDRPVATALHEAFGTDGVELVLFVDQLEELFSTATADVADRFLDTLGEALVDDRLGLRVVGTLRADYFGHPLTSAAFASLYRASIVATPPLAAADLEAAITNPAATVGVSCEPALVATLVGEVSQNPMALPLLQLTLTELFASRTGNEVTLVQYEEVGGLAGSLARRGESLVASLDDDDDVATVRELFGQLTDVDSERGPVRRRVPLVRLIETGIPVDVVDRVVESRLVALDRDVHSRAPIATVTHEAVLTGWPRLAAWLEADRELLRQRAQLMQAATAWQRDGRDVSGLLRGRRLDAAEDVIAVLPLGALEREFLAESTQVRDEEDQRERARLRRLRSVAALAVTVALIAVTAGGIALRLRSEARDQWARAEVASARAETSRDEARARAEDAQTAALARSAQALARTQPVLARQLAVEALDRSDEPSTRQALASVLSAAPHFTERVAQLGKTTCAAMSSGGMAQGAVLGVTKGRGGTTTATIIDVTSGRTTAQLVVPPTLNTRCPQPNASGSAVWASTDSDSVIVTDDGTVSTDTPLERSAWTNDQQAIVGVIPGDVGVAARLRVLDARDLDRLIDLEIDLDGIDNRPADVRATAPDGIAVVADGAHRVASVDLATGAQRFLPAAASPDPDIAINIDVSDDGTVVVARGERSLLVWQIGGDDIAPARPIELTGSPIDLAGTTGSPVRPQLSPSGARVAVITSAGIETFDIATGAPVIPPIEVAVSAGALRFLAEDRLAVLTAAGDVLHFDLAPAPGLATTIADDVPGGHVSRDGASLTGVENERLVTVSLPEGQRSDHGPAGAVRVVEAGAGVRFAYHPRTTEVVRFEDGIETHRRSLAHLVDPGNALGPVPRIAHDRIMLVLRGRSNFDNPTGQVVVLDVDTAEVIAAHDLPDARRAELLSGDEFIHGDFTGGATVRSLDGDVVDELPALPSSVQSFAGTASGELLLGLDDGTTLVWSRTRGEVVRELAGPPETVVSVGESADGTIVSQHLSGRITVWWPESDALGAQVLGPVGFTGIITVVDDTVRVAAAGDVLEISLDVDEWRRRACDAAGQQTDPVRWQAAVGTEPPDTGPCT